MSSLELNGGAVWAIEQRLERAVHTQQLTEPAHALKIGETAVLGSKEGFAPALWTLAIAPPLATARQSGVCAEGAAWIWKLADQYFPVSRPLVAWFPATQPRAQAAQTRLADDQAPRQRWLKRQRERLDLDKVQAILTALEPGA